MFSKENLKNLLYIFIAAVWFVPLSSFAMEIHRVPTIPVKNDISLSPAKVELSLNPGDGIIKYLNVQNRTGRNMVFNVEVQDFSPSNDNQGGVILNKTIKGLDSSLKRYISVDGSSFMMSQGEEARIPVKIKLPSIVNSGGLYAAVLISARSADDNQGATKVVTRLGALFLVKVNGSVIQEGSLKSVSFKDNKFEIVFENSGDVHLTPYGLIEIVDGSKKVVSKINLDAWFVLPKSVRFRFAEVSGIGSGKYTANFTINRGYNDIVDKKSLSFEVNNPIEDKSLPMFWTSIVVAISLILLYKFAL